jgi:O-antigen ligase
VTDTEVRARSLPDLRTLAGYWPGWRDVSCLALLVLSTWYLAGQDGGRPYRAMLPVLAVSVVVMIATYPRLARTPGWFRWLALAWVAGPLIALAFAEVRAGWVRPVAASAIAVPVVLATLQVLWRSWGQTALIVVVGLAGLRAWYWGALVWWAGGGSRGETAWMSLSWHNQSGTLMGALGVGALGIALVRTGWSRALAVIAAALGLSAAWLSASRGAILATGLGLGVAVATRLRRPERAAGTITMVAAMGLAVLVVVSLSAAYAQGGVRTVESATIAPVTGRGEDAAGNLRARIGHWEAAARMFAGAPLTGTGPGSYRWSSVPVYPDDTNLTASAHNEPLEVLGEQGLLGGGAAVLAAYLGLAWLTLAVIRRSGRVEIELAAAATVVVLATHALTDFDWDYSILLAVLAIAGATLIHSQTAIGDDGGVDAACPASRHPSAVAVVLLAAGVAVLSIGGVWFQTTRTVSWELDGRLRTALLAAAEGDMTAADGSLAVVRTWNPGAPRLEATEHLIAHATGRVDDEALARAVDPAAWVMADQLLAASHLTDAGRSELAQDVLASVRPLIEARRAWGVEGRAEELVAISLSLAWYEGGCAAATTAWAAEQGWLEDHAGSDVTLVTDGQPWADCTLS